MEINRNKRLDPGWDIRLDLSDAKENNVVGVIGCVSEARPVCFVQVRDAFEYQETGYIFVETGQGAEPTPSGLSVTTSDLWFFLTSPDGTMVTLPTECLRAVCNRVRDEHPERWNVRGGDNNVGVLVTMNELFGIEGTGACEADQNRVSPPDMLQ
jgi:hypothetical protein